MRLLHFVRNDHLFNVNLFMPFAIIQPAHLREQAWRLILEGFPDRGDFSFSGGADADDGKARVVIRGRCFFWHRIGILLRAAFWLRLPFHGSISTFLPVADNYLSYRAAIGADSLEGHVPFVKYYNTLGCRVLPFICLLTNPCLMLH